MKIVERKKYWVLGSILILLIAFGVILSLTFLNEDWLKAKIEKYAREKYQTDINIESLRFFVLITVYL